MMQIQSLEIKVPSEIDNIVRVENFIEILEEYFKLPHDELFGRISLSLIETVNNSILHGNERDASKTVKISAQKIGNQFKITVSDDGVGFDYRNIPDPTDPKNIDKENGHGVYIMENLSDELIFENNGASVTLVFNLNFFDISWNE